MKIKFFEVTEPIRNDKGELVDGKVLKILKDFGHGAVGNVATEADKAQFATEFAEFEKAKQLEGFDAFLAEKKAELEAEFLAAKGE